MLGRNQRDWPGGGGPGQNGPVTEPVVLIDDPRPYVRRLTLNRPDKRNALSHQLRTELFTAIRAADIDATVRVLIIRGSGPCFSAGYDLKQDRSETPPWQISPADGAWARHVLHGWFELMDLSKPLIAQVHGWCLAGGTELATACDLVYVADDAQIGYPPVRSMSSPDMAWHPWLMGMRRAMEAMLTGDSMSGTEAVASGFANRSFPSSELTDAVLDMAERVARVPPELQAINKRVVHRAMEAMGMRDGMKATADLNALGFHQRASRDYFAQLSKGVTAALSERDAGFGDYRES